jgi:hypothetical protein
MSEEETGGTQEHPLVAEFMTPAPSLPFDLMRRKEDGSEKAYPFRCRLLRYEQQSEALIAARKYTAEALKIDPSRTDAIESSVVFREAQAFEIAWRSCVQVERRKQSNGVEIDLPLFASPKQMRTALEVAEVEQMINAMQVTRAYYKFDSDMTDEKVETLIDLLANELTGGYFLAQLDSDEQPRLIVTLARLAQSWRPAMPPTPSSSENSSGSDQESSESGITTSSPLPSAHVSGSPNSEKLSGMQLPTTGQLSKEEARELVKKQLGEEP